MAVANTDLKLIIIDQQNKWFLWQLERFLRK
jgi:hypothetical protein